ncbi:hypothetical protein [Thermodesulfatator atlanticus]|uniref:hypothetical protein n=1 Tax=Thermodesulfatator atlanticus TaxID=501497 RepID=UPI0012FB8A66|nr:hypothetical protein [Thermodesulfatator atlanticus]
MMIITDFYYFIDYKGECNPPSLSEVEKLAKNDIVTVLLLDNNVCQDLALFYINRDKLPPKQANKVETLMLLIDHSKVDVIVYLGILELATDRATLTVNNEKFLSFSKKILNLLSSYEYTKFNRNFTIDYIIDEKEAPQNVYPIINLLLLFYVHLLKIYCISREGLNKEKAFANLEKYIYWAEKLGIQTIYPIQVALAIFGGDTKARKVLNIKKYKDPFQSIWGAAWDLFYLFIVQQYSIIFPLNKIYHRSIFVTNDAACFDIASCFSFRGAIKENDQIITILGEILVEYPHFKNQYEKVRKLFNDIKHKQLFRIIKRMSDSSNFKYIKRLKEEKERLEVEIMKYF